MNGLCELNEMLFNIYMKGQIKMKSSPISGVNLFLLM